MKKLFLIFIIITMSISATAAINSDVEIAAYQMNSCILSIYNINNSKSLDSYYKEKDRLSLISREGYVKIEEVKNIREKIYATMQQLQITQEEREVLKQIQALEKQGAKWKAISNGLNQVMVFVPGGGRSGSVQQAAFYALLTAARAAVDYNVSANQASIEEAKVLWKIREKDLNNIAFLNTTANQEIDAMFTKYKLKDEYELTESQVKDFVRIISITDPVKRSQNLLSNSNSFKYLNEYNYYLGMSFIEQGNYSKAKKYFDEYIRIEKIAKIYRSDSDNMLGCIMLAKLAYEDKAPVDQKKVWISSALKNMKHNGATLIECAAAYANMNDFDSAFSLLNDGLNDDVISDKEAIIMAITIWMNKLNGSKYSEEIYNSVCSMIENNVDNINFSTYLYFLIKCGNKKSFSEINNLLQICPIDDADQLDVFDDVRIIFNNSYSINKDDFSVFAEKYEDNTFTVKERRIAYVKGLKKNKLQKDFDILKDYPDLLYLFFDYQKLGDQFFVKRNISDETIRRMMKSPANYKDFQNLDISGLTEEKSTNRKNLMSLLKYIKEDNEKHRNDIINKTQLLLDGNLSKIHTEKENGFVDNYFQGVSHISSFNIEQCQDTAKVIEKYSEDVSRSEKSKYNYTIPLSYSKYHLRIILCGKDIDDVGIVYAIDGNKYNVESYILGNQTFFSNDLKINRVTAPVIEPSIFEKTLNKASEFGNSAKSTVKEWLSSDSENKNDSIKKENSTVKKAENEPGIYETAKAVVTGATNSAVSTVKGWFSKEESSKKSDASVEKSK